MCVYCPLCRCNLIRSCVLADDANCGEQASVAVLVSACFCSPASNSAAAHCSSQLDWLHSRVGSSEEGPFLVIAPQRSLVLWQVCALHQRPRGWLSSLRVGFPARNLGADRDVFGHL